MTTLVVDGNNVAYKAFYTTGVLSANGLLTGVLFGALKIVFSVCKQLKPNNVVFIFDSRSNRRNEICAEYKANRKPVDKEQEKQRQILYNQINDLRLIVKRMGFPVYKEEGYEADDLIASLVRNNSDGEFIILSTDKDLYQLLCKNVSVFDLSKKKLFTEKDFYSEYTLMPSQWPVAKAIMGDPGDNVIGLNGIGLKTVTCYFNGVKISKSKKQLIENNNDMIKLNLKLVKLPFDGTPKLGLEQHKFNSKMFFNILRRYKMYSLKTDEWEKLFCR